MPIIICSCGSKYSGHRAHTSHEVHLSKHPDHFEIERHSQLDNIHRKKNRMEAE